MPMVYRCKWCSAIFGEFWSKIFDDGSVMCPECHHYIDDVRPTPAPTDLCPANADGKHHYHQDTDRFGVVFDCDCGKRR
jgi:DNA-directed RNA polymerase subunit RPC12/RpoP